MQILPDGSRVGFTRFPKWSCYHPIKNDIATAVKLSDAGIPADSPAEGEAAVYHTSAQYLRLLGAVSCSIEFSDLGFSFLFFSFHFCGPVILLICNLIQVVEDPVERTFRGVKVNFGPRIVFDASFCPAYFVLATRFIHPTKVRITQRSTLIISGSGVTIEKLILDGTLIIRTASNVHVRVADLTVSNGGWRMLELQDTDASLPQSIQIRGFKIEKFEQCVIELNNPGRFVIERRDNCFVVCSEADGSVVTMLSPNLLLS
jgi:hypothetical protein